MSNVKVNNCHGSTNSSQNFNVQLSENMVVESVGGGQQHGVRRGARLRPRTADVQQHRGLWRGGAEAHRLRRRGVHAGKADAQTSQGVSYGNYYNISSNYRRKVVTSRKTVVGIIALSMALLLVLCCNLLYCTVLFCS